jgi:acetylornithine deacetylase/succinyl-diaminopimelate desuccinylase-like protein
LFDSLATVGRGLAIWTATISRDGPPVHEVMRDPTEPSVVSAAARLIRAIDELDESLHAARSAVDPDASNSVDPGRASVFVGQVHAGEIYNQSPRFARVEGTRRWPPGSDRRLVEREFRALLENVARDTRTEIDCRWFFTRDAFRLDLTHPIVAAFQAAHHAISGEVLPPGPKPFVDDGNSFWSLAGASAITHGPRARGQHTLDEWVSIADMERVALLYAAVAATFCPPHGAATP